MYDREETQVIYADHAATTKPCRAAREAMLDCMERAWGNPSSLYLLGQQANAVLQNARADVARCIGALPREIILQRAC